MSAQLSIVIPVLNAAEALPATLDALLPGVAQGRRGAQAARGQWLLFLHADTHLPPHWVGAVCTHQDPQLAGYFRLSFRSNAAMARVIAGGANLRSRALGLPYGDQGLPAPSRAAW